MRTIKIIVLFFIASTFLLSKSCEIERDIIKYKFGASEIVQYCIGGYKYVSLNSEVITQMMSKSTRGAFPIQCSCDMNKENR